MNEHEELELRRQVEKAHSISKWVIFGCKITAGGVLFLIAIIFLWKLVSPRLDLYRSNTTKQSVIAEQEAQSKAAEYAARSRVTQAEAEAAAEIIRAEGLQKAQAIIAETLTPEYLHYLYIQNLAIANEHGATIIYVPTEAGLPILEADRLGDI